MSFPISPANNTTTVVNGITYIYNTAFQAWRIVPGGANFTDTTARAQANAAFTQANTAITLDSWSRTQANAAFAAANTGGGLSAFLLMGA